MRWSGQGGDGGKIKEAGKRASKEEPCCMIGKLI